MSTLTIDLDDHLAGRLAAIAAQSRKPLPEWAAEQLTRIASSAADPYANSYSAEWRAAFGSIDDSSFNSPTRLSPRPVAALDAQ